MNSTPPEPNRFDLMRAAGVDGTRLDGSMPDRETDAHARRAEIYVGQIVGGSVQPVSDKADFGYDVAVGVLRIGVHATKYRVRTSHLIYHRRKSLDRADLYVLVCTSHSGKPRFAGWAWSSELRAATPKALDERYAAAPSLHTSELRPLIDLCHLIRNLPPAFATSRSCGGCT